MTDDPSALITTIELTWIEKQVKRWLRFGCPVADTILDHQRRVVSFVPGSVFAVVRWAANEYLADSRGKCEAGPRPTGCGNASGSLDVHHKTARSRSSRST